MEFTVHYWYSILAGLTGFEQGDTITEEQVHALICEAKVNVLIHHSKDGKSHTCFIDDINHRFQQR